MSPRNLEYDVRGPDIPRELFPQGRIRFSLGVSSKREASKRRRWMHQLRTWLAWDVLHALEQGAIHPAEVCRRLQQSGEAGLQELRRELEAQRVGAPPTFREEADRYLDWYRRKRGEQSMKQTESRLKRVGEQEIDGRPVDDAPLPEVGAVLERAVEAVSDHPSTQASLLTAVSGLFTWSIERERQEAKRQARTARWDENPATDVEVREDTARARSAPPTFSEDEVVRLLAAGQLYQRAYVRAFAHLGLRLAELIHTRLHDDLDLETWEWRIQGRGPDPRCGCPKCGGRGWSPKTKRSVRTLIVPGDPPGLREEIAAYLEAEPTEPGDFAFRNPRTGGVWNDGALQRDFARLCEAAGIEYGRESGRTIHVLRHTCATNLIRAGVRESVVAAILGDTVQTVVRVYVHLTPDDLADGIKRGPGYAV